MYTSECCCAKYESRQGNVGAEGGLGAVEQDEKWKVVFLLKSSKRAKPF